MGAAPDQGTRSTDPPKVTNNETSVAVQKCLVKAFRKLQREMDDMRHGDQGRDAKAETLHSTPAKAVIDSMLSPDSVKKLLFVFMALAVLEAAIRVCAAISSLAD